MPMLAEAKAAPEYFGAINYESASLAPGAPKHNAMAVVPTAPNNALSTNGGKTLRTLALLVPIFFVLFCVVSIAIALLFKFR